MILTAAERQVSQRDVDYQSMAELGLSMLQQARAAGHLAGCWVTADEAYGKVPTLRDDLDADGMAVRAGSALQPTGFCATGQDGSPGLVGAWPTSDQASTG